LLERLIEEAKAKKEEIIHSNIAIINIAAIKILKLDFVKVLKIKNATHSIIESEKIAMFCKMPVSEHPMTINAKRHKIADMNKNNLSCFEILDNESLICETVVLIADGFLSICLTGACLRRLLEIPDIEAPFH
jgi:hypothetical protein